MSDPKHLQTDFLIRTSGSGLHEFTTDVVRWLGDAGPASGLLTPFVRHTSCSILVQENADPDVCHDLDGFLGRLVPDADHPAMRHLRHTLEDPDDMPAHIKAALLPISLSIPVRKGRMTLGTWQGIYRFEHRARGRPRNVPAHFTVG